MDDSILDEDFIVEETQPITVSPASLSRRLVNRFGIISQTQPQPGTETVNLPNNNYNWCQSQICSYISQFIKCNMAMHGYLMH